MLVTGASQCSLMLFHADILLAKVCELGPCRRLWFDVPCFQYAFCPGKFASHESPTLICRMGVAQPTPPHCSHFAAFVVLVIAVVSSLLLLLLLLLPLLAPSRPTLAAHCCYRFVFAMVLGLECSRWDFADVFLWRMTLLVVLMMFLPMLPLGVLHRKLRNMLQPIPRERSSLPEPQGHKRTVQLTTQDFSNLWWLGLILIDHSTATLEVDASLLGWRWMVSFVLEVHALEVHAGAPVDAKMSRLPCYQMVKNGGG